MELFRIVREKYASKPEASGRSNRWNNNAEYVIYTSNNRALSVLELVVHRSSIMSASSYKLLTLSIPDGTGYVKSINRSGLPKDWQLLKNYSITQKIGSDWYKSEETLVLKVPSAIVRGEFNYIINTSHKDFDQVKIKRVEDFEWDKRLL